MKKCIWCVKTDEGTTFDLEAHILPQSLGSKETFENECDECNQYFGKRLGSRKPSIDIALKETLILSRVMKVGSLIRYNSKEILGRRITKNEIQNIQKSTELFKVDFDEEGANRITPKKAFSYYLQEPKYFTNSLKRGLLKVGFEKAIKEDVLPENFGSFYDQFYDYVRNFVRWDKGNPKLYYFRRKIGIELLNLDFLTAPKVTLYSIENNYLKFEIMGHIFATSLGKSNLTAYEFEQKNKHDNIFELVKVNSFLDIDIFNIVFSGK